MLPVGDPLGLAHFAKARGALRRPGLFRRHRRSRLQANLPVAPANDPARQSERARHWRRQSRLESRAASQSRQRQPDPARRRRSRRLRQIDAVAAIISTAITRTRPPSRSFANSSARPSFPRITWPFLPAFFPPSSKDFALRAAPKMPASSSKSPSAAISPRPKRSTPLCTPPFPSPPSFASIITWARKPSRICSSSVLPTPFSSPSGIATTSHSVQITMAESFGVAGRGKFYEEAGAIRDVVQNHLLQVVGFLTMDPPTSLYAESLRDEQVNVFRTIPPLQPDRRRARPIRRLSPGSRCRSRFQSGNLRRRAPGDRFLALGRRPVLAPLRQVPAGHRHGSAREAEAASASPHGK